MSYLNIIELIGRQSAVSWKWINMIYSPQYWGSSDGIDTLIITEQNQSQIYKIIGPELVARIRHIVYDLGLWYDDHPVPCDEHFGMLLSYCSHRLKALTIRRCSWCPNNYLQSLNHSIISLDHLHIECNDHHDEDYYPFVCPRTKEVSVYNCTHNFDGNGPPVLTFQPGLRNVRIQRTTDFDDLFGLLQSSSDTLESITFDHTFDYDENPAEEDMNKICIQFPKLKSLNGVPVLR